jgi:hypothetical protein
LGEFLFRLSVPRMNFNTIEVKWPSPFLWFFMDFWSEFEALMCRSCLHNIHIFLFRYDSTALMDLDLLIVEVSKSYSVRRITICMTPRDGWTANRRHIYLITHHTHTNTHTHTRDRHLWTRRDSNPQGAAEIPRLKPRGHWERPYVLIGNSTLLFFVSEKFLELVLQQSA